AIKLNAEVVGSDRDNQLLHLAHGMDEWMPLAAQQRSRRYVLQTQLMPVIRQNLRTLAKTISVLAKVLQIGEIVVAGQDPGAHAPDAGLLKSHRRCGQLGQAFIKGG